jgi:ABC-type branched-subunit amino acid transport system permease subunit
MNKYLKNNYTLFGREVEKQDKLTDVMRSIVKKPVLQYLLFAVVMVIVGYLAAERILPYSWQSSIATTLAYGIAAIGFCLLMGYSGLASLGTGGFIGIGTYAWRCQNSFHSCTKEKHSGPFTIPPRRESYCHHGA